MSLKLAYESIQTPQGTFIFCSKNHSTTAGFGIAMISWFSNRLYNIYLLNNFHIFLFNLSYLSLKKK